MMFIFKLLRVPGGAADNNRQQNRDKNPPQSQHKQGCCRITFIGGCDVTKHGLNQHNNKNNRNEIADQKIPIFTDFPIGYGVETSMILDIYEKWGLDVMAQVDLERRVHRNQDTKALGKMAFVILNTFVFRLEKLGIVKFNKSIYYEMIQYNLVRNEYQPDIFKIQGVERPPMTEIPEYREKFNLK